VTPHTQEQLRQQHARLAYRNVISLVAAEIWQRDHAHHDVEYRGASSLPPLRRAAK